jgi:hypothetical protein
MGKPDAERVHGRATSVPASIRRGEIGTIIDEMKMTMVIREASQGVDRRLLRSGVEHRDREGVDDHVGNPDRRRGLQRGLPV